MDWDSPAFVIIIVAMVMATAIITTWIQSRARAKTDASTRKANLLDQENAGLKDQVGRLEERLEVLERIATDPSRQLATEIEQLR